MDTTNQNTNQDESLTSGTNISYWTRGSQVDNYAKLNANLETDVVIVGGGFAGVSVAYNLTLAGLKVVLVEDGQIASGETGRTSAHLTNVLDTRYFELEKKYGAEKTAMIAQSHAGAIDFIEETVRLQDIKCQFKRVSGYLFRHPSDEVDVLQKELRAVNNAGIDAALVNGELGFIPSQPALHFANQAQFQPIDYVKGLCHAIIHNGGNIFTHTHAAKIETEGITTDEGFTVKAKHVVVTTNSPVNNKYALHLTQFAYRTYVIGALVKKGELPAALWWDTGDYTVNKDLPPYHYVRTTEYDEEHDLLICGGEDHPTGNTADIHIPEHERYSLLEEWARAHFPITKVVYQWSGQVLEPMDGLAYIGHNPWGASNIYIVTGISGNGLTYSTIAGRLITDLIQGNHNELEKVYSPARLKIRELGLMFREIMKTFLNSPEADKNANLTAVKQGEGKLIDLNGETFGVYRDEHGKLHVVGAECTHLGCLINWNNDELTWDCPCHGSRFNYEGKVLNGPANTPLPSYSHTANK